MTVNFEKTGSITGELKFTIDREVVEKGLNKTFNQVKGSLQVPGFRKGRVPRKLFNQMYGEESLYEDTLNDIFPTAYSEALEEVEEEVVGQPSIKDISWEPGKDWELEVEVSLKPEVKLGQYKDLEVTKYDREVTDEDVEESLENRRTQFAELVIKEDAPAEEGDTVVIDYEGSVDGEVFEGGSATNYSLELGSDSFIPGFEEQLIGAETGSEVEVKVTFPEDYHAEDLAGKEAVFNVTVHEIKAKELPELDDEFAKDVDDEVETIDELRGKIREELETTRKQYADEARDEEAIRKAVENAEIPEIPYDMTHEEVHRQMDMFYNNLQQQGMTPEMYFNITQTSEADLHDQFEVGAEDSVRTNLVIEAIVEAEGLAATEEEQEKEINELAEQYNLSVEQVREVLSPELLTRDIAMKKAVDLISSSAKEVLEPVEEEVETEEDSTEE
ncbi:MAG TPA: trigger factor [Atopostipes sp.]|nr:trigger factor [Atopostipes sp.]